MLTFRELYIAADHGVVRRMQALAGSAGDRNGAPGDGPWQNDIDSAIAELCVAKALNRYPLGAAGIGLGDVGGIVEVRSTKYAAGHLIIRPRDLEEHPDSPMILVTGADAMWREIRGWRRCSDAPTIGEAEGGERGECWKVAQRDLLPLETLTEGLPDEQ